MVCGMMRAKTEGGDVFLGIHPVPRPGFVPKAGFSSPGSAIAYSAYTFPEALVHTTFHDYYIVLAVLNTILSTGLSCYSRYRLSELRWEDRAGGLACNSVAFEGSVEEVGWVERALGAYLHSKWIPCR